MLRNQTIVIGGILNAFYTPFNYQFEKITILVLRIEKLILILIND